LTLQTAMKFSPRILHVLSLSLLLSFVCASAQVASAPNLVLQGTVRPSQKQTYFSIPFMVPPGTHRITITFHNLGHDQHTVLDLGLADPFRFRGQSGGNKDHFTLSDTDATPSYLPGAIPAGRWKILVSVPNIRPGAPSPYRAEVWFNSALDDSSFTQQPLDPNPGWYRGDLHMHDAHSDGSCASQSGKPVPCPLFLTIEAAVRRGLDFIAITDHNATSQYDDERELQPYFDKTLLIPGRELTTFHGHANEWGTTRFIDYRVGTPQVPNVNAMFRSARALGAIVSINHPEAPTGEICMGCGWNPSPPTDMSLVTSIEVVNGPGRPATRFWEDQLRQGYRLTAVGGSDNHHAPWPPEHPGSVGDPTTVIYAQNLSVSALLDGIRAGRVFIDVSGSGNRFFDLEAHAGDRSAEMGSLLDAPAGSPVSLDLHVANCQGATANWFIDGVESTALPSQSISSADQTLRAQWTSDGSRHWIRAEVRDSNDRLLLLGNPVYLNWPARAATASAHHHP
ncbi:MAG: CehA/McbA family metallohydrolase, partial [Acidobacteriaceae bacterium]